MTKIVIKAELNSFSLEKLKELEHYMVHDKTNNDNNVAGIIAFLPICQDFEMCQCKINTALDMVKTLAQAYFEEHCADGEGNIKIARNTETSGDTHYCEGGVRMSD